MREVNKLKALKLLGKNKPLFLLTHLTAACQLKEWQYPITYSLGRWV